jgi:hypothetical protein
MGSPKQGIGKDSYLAPARRTTDANEDSDLSTVQIPESDQTADIERGRIRAKRRLAPESIHYSIASRHGREATPEWSSRLPSRSSN